VVPRVSAVQRATAPPEDKALRQRGHRGSVSRYQIARGSGAVTLLGKNDILCAPMSIKRGP